MEIRYATLLHDFGKIAVREEVLVKAQKLYPAQLTVLRQRFDCCHQALEAEYTRKKLEAVLVHGQAGHAACAEFDKECAQKRAELNEDLQFIVRINEASIRPEGNFERLMDISQKTYCDSEGVTRNLLTSGEIASLSVRQGSLNDDERREIESHVAHSFNFLSEIPWTPDLRYIPWIVRAHHEKLNGNGYPYHLRATEIPVQAKMMTICDMFDAISAADRPYKRALPVDKTLEILEACALRNELDPDLLRIFVDARVFALSDSAAVASPAEYATRS
jgi:response regulator RpfG family c-di-GMP phosphodiesterase